MSEQRNACLKALSSIEFDVVVVGAGINGAVSAAALAAAGAKVALIDKADFAGNTSSNSSNLIWGGIKYLESHEYRLVNKLCQCRNRLMRLRPSSVAEIRFLTTVQRGFRFPPAFMFAGTLLYWTIGRFFTQGPRRFKPASIKRREPVIKITNATGGFEYSDCHLADGDARFVFQLVKQCQRTGGVVANYVESTGASFANDSWSVQAADRVTGKKIKISAKSLVNACGPEVDLHNRRSQLSTATHHLYSKGIHLIVPKLTKGNRILAFFASDGRLFFITPIGSRSCIGTTDTRVDHPDVAVSDEDRAFILDNANRLLDLERPLTMDDVVAERCGVRPLAVEGSTDETDWLQMSRKHIIESKREQRHMSIFGGKLTDCLNVGEEVVAGLKELGLPLDQLNDDWCGESADARAAFFKFAVEVGLDDVAQPLREPLSQRLWRRYEEQAHGIVEAIVADPKLARPLFRYSDYCWAELNYALEHEMVVTLEDLIRRRSDIALTVGAPDLEPMTIQQIIAQGDLLTTMPSPTP